MENKNKKERKQKGAHTGGTLTVLKLNITWKSTKKAHKTKKSCGRFCTGSIDLGVRYQSFETQNTTHMPKKWRGERKHSKLKMFVQVCLLQACFTKSKKSMGEMYAQTPTLHFIFRVDF